MLWFSMMQETIGITAGQVWDYLNQKGPATIIKLKSNLEVSNTMLCLALGWLAREDKIVISKMNHTYEISLKQTS